MLTAVRTCLSSLSVEIESQSDLWEQIWSAALPEQAMGERPSIQATPVDAEFVAVSEMLEQLIRMNRASLLGYSDLYHSANDSILQIFLEVVMRERSAQCERLERAYQKISRRALPRDSSEDSLTDPSAAEVHVMWSRAIWCFEHEQFGRLLDDVDSAEILLEDAYLTASHTLPNSSLGALFQEYAIDVCGSRQRFEELTYDLVSESQSDAA